MVEIQNGLQVLPKSYGVIIKITGVTCRGMMPGGSMLRDALHSDSQDDQRKVNNKKTKCDLS